MDQRRIALLIHTKNSSTFTFLSEVITCKLWKVQLRVAQVQLALMRVVDRQGRAGQSRCFNNNPKSPTGHSAQQKTEINMIN